MLYLPAISDARHVRSYKIGPYLGTLVTDCQSAGEIEYTHVLFIYQMVPLPKKETPPPCVMAVAAEVNSFVGQFGGGSHFLGVFPGSGHENWGDSDQWADLDIFADKALEIVQDRLHVSEPPVLLEQE